MKKSFFTGFQIVVLFLGLVLSLMACGGSDSGGGMDCSAPDTIESPKYDVSGWWLIAKNIENDEYEYYAVYIDQSGSYLEGYVYDEEGDETWFTGYLSGITMYWELEDLEGVKIAIDMMAPDNDAFVGSYQDCTDGTSGDVSFEVYSY